MIEEALSSGSVRAVDPAGLQWLQRGCLAGRRMRLPILGMGSLLQGFPEAVWWTPIEARGCWFQWGHGRWRQHQGGV